MTLLNGATFDCSKPIYEVLAALREDPLSTYEDIANRPYVTISGSRVRTYQIMLGQYSARSEFEYYNRLMELTPETRKHLVLLLNHGLDSSEAAKDPLYEYGKENLDNYLSNHSPLIAYFQKDWNGYESAVERWDEILNDRVAEITSGLRPYQR